MNRGVRQIPTIEIDAQLDRDTARQIVDGIKIFASQLNTEYDGGSGSFTRLQALVEQCLSLDLALPTGLRLGLRALKGSFWRKPWIELRKSIESWHPVPPDQREHLIPVIGDPDATCDFLEDADARSRRIAQHKKDRRVRQQIACRLEDTLQMLSQLSQAAELKILGKSSISAPRKKSAARASTEQRLRDYYFCQLWLIEYLRERIESGDTSAIRIAKRDFGRNALAKRLSLAQGTVSRSETYEKLKVELQLDAKVQRSSSVCLEAAMEAMSVARSKRVSDEQQSLLNRLECCLERGQIAPGLVDAFQAEILDDEGDHEQVEKALVRAERGEDVLGPG